MLNKLFVETKSLQEENKKLLESKVSVTITRNLNTYFSYLQNKIMNVKKQIDKIRMNFLQPKNEAYNFHKEICKQEQDLLNPLLNSIEKDKEIILQLLDLHPELNLSAGLTLVNNQKLVVTDKMKLLSNLTINQICDIVKIDQKALEKLSGGSVLPGCERITEKIISVK